jgi:hypothetical protein
VSIVTASACLAVFAVAGAGCGNVSRIPRHIPRDTVAGAHSEGVLADYDQGRPAVRPHRPGLPETIAQAGAPPWPGIAAAQVALPGNSAKPWEGPPRTAATLVGPTEPAPAQQQSGPRPGASPVAAEPDALRPGDRVRVDVADHPEFGGEWRVQDDGLLDIPATGAFSLRNFAPADFSARLSRVAGQPPQAVARRIAEQLRPYLRRRPGVTVVLLGRAEG